MITVTLKYGLTKEITTEVSEDSTIAQIIGNANNKAVLGLPETVKAVIDGQTVDLNEKLSDGDVVVLERQAAEKAA